MPAEPQRPPPQRNLTFSSLRQWMSSSLRWLFSSSDIQLDEEAVRRLAETEESENIEFKQRLLLYKELAEYAVGIGNAGGGLLVMFWGKRQEASEACWHSRLKAGRPQENAA